MFLMIQDVIHNTCPCTKEVDLLHKIDNVESFSRQNVPIVYKCNLTLTDEFEVRYSIKSMNLNF